MYRFLDFKQRMRLTLQQMLHHLRSGSGELTADCLAETLGAAALSQVFEMQSVRIVATALKRKLQTLSPRALVRTLHNYARCMELEADVHGGINITVEDREFTHMVLSELLVCASPALKTLNPSRESLNSLNPRDVVLLLKACDRLSLESPDLMQHIGQLALKRQPSFPHTDWATVVSGSTNPIPLTQDPIL